MAALKLHIIRHAPVIGKKGLIYGDEADIDLENHKETIRSLALTLPSPDRADWYHSGVDRAHRTAKAVLADMNFSDISASSHEGFREQNFGQLIGKKHEDVINYLQFIDGKIYAPAPPGGESIPLFIARVAKNIASVKKAAIANGKDDIVIFSHGGTIRAVHAAVLKLQDEKDFIILDTPPLFSYTCNIESFVVPTGAL